MIWSLFGDLSESGKHSENKPPLVTNICVEITSTFFVSFTYFIRYERFLKIWWNCDLIKIPYCAGTFYFKCHPFLQKAYGLPYVFKSYYFYMWFLTHTINILWFLQVIAAVWGQFLYHDVAHTPQMAGHLGQRLKCCNVEFEDFHPECYPIKISEKDPFYKKFGLQCQEYARSGTASRVGCTLGTVISISIFNLLALF